MDYQNRIEKWLIRFKKYLFSYKDGYFILPYISNSPQIMLASFKKMPYTHYDAANSYIETNNPFTNGVMYYRELEEGLWIIVTEIEFKKNVSTHALHDNEPSDYYFLSHFRYTHQLNDSLVNEVSVPAVGWGLYKPGTQVNAYFSENDKGVFMDICFNRAWFDKYISTNDAEGVNSMNEWLSSNKTFKIWQDIVEGSEERVNTILNYLKETNSNNKNLLSLKIICLDLVMRFIASISAMPSDAALETINEKDRSRLATVEKMLLESLMKGFPGIILLAETIHMSPTKLKIQFKKVYGNSILQYYQEKQMLLALELLKIKGKTVKEVAHSLGYDKSSNFTKVFKKYHQFLPSEIN